jgi:hypothetical protein
MSKQKNVTTVEGSMIPTARGMSILVMVVVSVNIVWNQRLSMGRNFAHRNARAVG